jgi:hypothetical protein
MIRIAFPLAIALILCAITITLTKLGSDARAKPDDESSAPSAQNKQCNVTIKVGKPTLTGPLPRPTHVNVSWTVENLPLCYRVSASRVTFNIVAQDGANETIKWNINGNATTASAPINIPSARIEKLFPINRPAVITATVETTAVPIAPSYTHTDVQTAEVIRR